MLKLRAVALTLLSGHRMFFVVHRAVKSEVPTHDSAGYTS
jgi:hypothetical protein